MSSRKLWSVETGASVHDQEPPRLGQRPIVIMLIGLPGSGKTSYYTKHLSNFPRASTDDYIEAVARINGQTYNEVFEDNIKMAEKHMNKVIEIHIKNRQSFVWDQTNLSKSTRKKKLSRIPAGWQKKYVYISATPEHIEAINEQRKATGRNLSPAVLNRLINSFERPDTDEGWDTFVVVAS